MRLITLLLLVMLWLPQVSFAVELTPEQQQAKQQGIASFMQRWNLKAIPLLEPAANAGDSDAQYYLAESIRLHHRYINAEAYHWYELAAEQGDLYAMIRLGSSPDFCRLFGNCTYPPKTWLAKAKEQALTRAKQGDAEAMGLLTTLTKEVSWLEKSAKAGNGYYQYLLANYYMDDDYAGELTSIQERKAAQKKWTIAAAQSGYVPAMYECGYYFAEDGDIEQGRQWVLKAVDAGNINSIIAYATLITDEVLSKKYNIFQFPLDRIKGYALASLVVEIGGGSGDTAKFILGQVSAQMTPEEIEQAKAYAEQWRNTHPPLSEFTPKLWY